MYFYGYRHHQPHAFVNKLNCINIDFESVKKKIRYYYLLKITRVLTTCIEI